MQPVDAGSELPHDAALASHSHDRSVRRLDPGARPETGWLRCVWPAQGTQHLDSTVGAQRVEIERSGHRAHQLARHGRSVRAHRHDFHECQPARALRGPASACIELEREVALPGGARGHAQGRGRPRQHRAPCRPPTRVEGESLDALAALPGLGRRGGCQRCIVALRAWNDPVEQPGVTPSWHHRCSSPAIGAIGVDEALDHGSRGARTIRWRWSLRRSHHDRRGSQQEGGS